MTRPTRLLPLILLPACGGTGTWTLEVWGEDYIEEGIDDTVFADGCSMTYDTFVVAFHDRALLDDDGEAVATIPGTAVWDLVPAGPQTTGSVEAPARTWRNVGVRIAPPETDDLSALASSNVSADELAALKAADASIHIAGTVTCGSDAVTFDLMLPNETAYLCNPENLVVGQGNTGLTQITIHGDHLFYNSLVDPDAEVVGQFWIDADANDDGALTEAELKATPIAPTGLDVGSEPVDTLWDYLVAAGNGVGHIDGEGHCELE